MWCRILLVVPNSKIEREPRPVGSGETMRTRRAARRQAVPDRGETRQHGTSTPRDDASLEARHRILRRRGGLDQPSGRGPERGVAHIKRGASGAGDARKGVAVRRARDKLRSVTKDPMGATRRPALRCRCSSSHQETGDAPPGDDTAAPTGAEHITLYPSLHRRTSDNGFRVAAHGASPPFAPRLDAATLRLLTRHS